MGTVLIIIGVILIIVSIITFFTKNSKAKQLLTFSASESAKVGELDAMTKEVAKDDALGGGGFFNKDVKISGKIGAENPLTSELGKKECVWYSSKVTREYETEETETDSEGNKHIKRETHSEVVSDRQESTEFYIDDGTGRIFVSMDKLDFDYEESFDEFKPYEEVRKNDFQMNFGGIVINIGGTEADRNDNNVRTIGYRYKENIIPIGKQALVTGDARDADGKLKLYKPKEDYLKFMLRFGSETEIVDGLKRSIETMNKVFPITGIIGIALLIVGIIL